MFKIFLSYLILLVTDVSQFRKFWLHSDFQVYVSQNHNDPINGPTNDSSAKILPTINWYRGQEGCYIACYSHKSNSAVYGISSGIFVMGQIRIPGKYVSRNCVAQHDDSQNALPEKWPELCSHLLPDQCPNLSCWGGGDTGGWFGIQ